jgi:hypothetical protein
MICRVRYCSGEEVREGDEVVLVHGKDKAPGKVIKVILRGSADAETWNAPDGGVLIEGGGLGLSLTVRLDNDPDVTFIGRRPTES